MIRGMGSALLRNLFGKWDSWKARKKMAKGHIHCVMCGKSLRLTIRQFLVMQYKLQTSDLPTCNLCQEIVRKAGAEDSDKIRNLKK